MKRLYAAFRFLSACAVIFGSGWFMARPRNDADRIFAPYMCGGAVYFLWRDSRDRLIPS
jgi:hypothetical protein